MTLFHSIYCQYVQYSNALVLSYEFVYTHFLYMWILIEVAYPLVL